jgi:hypothetical protein
MSMKCVEQSPTLIRYIRLRRLKRGEKVLVGSFVGRARAADVDRDCERDADGRTPATGHRDREAFEASNLLLKEMEESNNWARLALKLYFGFVALQFAVNSIVLGWLFTYNGPMPWFAGLIYLVFIVWNFMGTIGTVLVYKALVQSDARIRAVIEMMGLQLDSQDSWPRPQSPMPLSMIKLIFIFFAVTTFMSLAVWIVLFVARR